MKEQDILIVGAGIGGLAAAIALCRHGHRVTVIEKDPNWSVYGVGIIQQANVLRAMDQLGVLDTFLHAASGFDAVEVFIPDGTMVARVPSPCLVEGKPANVGIGRRALQKVLGDTAQALGAQIRLGVTAEQLEEEGNKVTVEFSDGGRAQFDLVIGADGRLFADPSGNPARCGKTAIYRAGGLAVQFAAARGHGCSAGL